MLLRPTLRHGTEARGLLYVPVDENTRTLVLHLPVGSHVVHIPFRQTKYEPEPLME